MIQYVIWIESSERSGTTYPFLFGLGQSANEFEDVFEFREVDEFV